MLRPRNPYRLRRAACFIQATTQRHPGLIAFPVMKTSDPGGRRPSKAEIIAFPVNSARAPIAPHHDTAA